MDMWYLYYFNDVTNIWLLKVTPINVAIYSGGIGGGTALKFAGEIDGQVVSLLF